MKNWRHRSAARIRALDARVTVFLGLLTGILTWKAGFLGVASYGLGLLAVLLILSATASIEKRVLRAYGLFILFWIVLKLGLEALLPGDGGLDTAVLFETALLGSRLFVLLCLGLTLTLMASPRALGLAMAWYARPLLGRSAWRAALALSLMIHFLPLSWSAAATIRETIGRRCPELPWHRRALLLPQATIRVLAQATWEQTLAIAARGLDSAAAWETNPRWSWTDVGVGAGVVGLVLCLVLV